MDVIITADRIDAGPSGAQALGIRDGRIVAVGDRREARAWRTARTRTIDVGDACVLPGFIDGHSHPVLGADLTRGVALGEVTTVAELQAALGAAHGTLPPDVWLHGWGLRPDALGGAEPHRRVIDVVVGGRPCLIRTFDGHSALANGAALRAAGVVSSVALEGEAQIVCDEQGAPTGYLREPAAVAVVEMASPAVPFAERARALRAALAGMARAGLTAVHSLEFPEGAAALYEALESEGSLPVRVRAMPWCEADATPDRWAEIAAMQSRAGRRWRVGGAKLFLDGTIDDGTAWLSEPDTRGASAASIWADSRAYAAAVAWFDARGIATATHAIGNAAVLQALDVIDRTRRAPHRIEHIEYLSVADTARFARSRAYAGMQPTHGTDYVDPLGSDNWSIRLGRERALRAWPLGDLDAAGVAVVLGSDWPIAPYDPRAVIAAAHLRRQAGRPSAPALARSQALSVQSAIDGYTVRAAASVADVDAGRIAVGTTADLTVFAHDPRTTDLDVFADAPVVATIVDGDPVHLANAW
ncbi:MAG: amidohydrolase family protein [Microbacterium sp.]|uniref:amidohydrolase n=1 Tax=Microbacterium sp. TaxID=51671 RepID=UPI001ACA3982|nr:amidohydrolase family protein [Microbacterium sp.]MBN9176068.1 amidohydrolase family protein [Microbacterium sp.]